MPCDSSSNECRFTTAGKPHCFEHIDRRCCGCDLLDPDAGPEEPQRCFCCIDEACGDCPETPGEPPMTPEEEEEAPEDEERPASPCPDWSMQKPHEAHDFETPTDGPARCPGWDEQPPQPDRRPPNAVAYSVNGHLYEVAVSGDASVRAVDGALVIQHHLGPVAGIVQVLPIIDKESAHGAEADH